MTKGKIHLIGLGPGDRNMLAPAAIEILSQCDVVIGYSGYVEQVSDIVQGKEIISMALGEEMPRAAKAVEIASSGKSVAVISSGDVGVYGMAAPVYQQLTLVGWDGENPDVQVIPGISALQSAASLLGSPLMQDFCAISLSDLMTPWETIRKRLDAAAMGDFVIALYNPRSLRRTKQIVEAREIFLKYRDESTPVGIVRNAYRPDQSVNITTLGELAKIFDTIDMFTTLIFGNSTTYVHGGRMITPRGYERAAVNERDN